MKNLYVTLATALLTATVATAQPKCHFTGRTLTTQGKAMNRLFKQQGSTLLKQQSKRANIVLHALDDEAQVVYTPTVDSLISQQPAGTLHDNYYRSGTCFINNMGYVERDVVKDGLVSRVVEAADGKTVYIYNPLCAYTSKAWIKGTRTQGDTIEVKLPQYLVHYDDAEKGDDAYMFKLKPVKGENGYTFVPDDDQTARFTWRNDTLSFVNTTKDSKLLGMCTPKGEWSGNGDYVWSQTPFVGTMVQPADAQAATTYAMEYVESGQEYGRIKRVTIEGNEVFVAGLDPQLPNAWIKGTINGSEVTFKGHQFLGIDSATETFRFFEPAATNRVDFDNDYYIDIVGLADEMSLTYDADAQTFEAAKEDVMLVNQGYKALNQAYAYEAPIMQPWTEQPATPDAVDQLAYTPYDESAGYGLISFIPMEYKYNEETEEYDELLDANKMYFNVFVDGQLMTFKPADYWALDADMTNIPFDFTDNYDFVPYYGQYNIRTHFTTPCTHIGVQVVYTGGGEVHKSPVVYIGGDGNEVDDDVVAGVNQVETKGAKPVVYYDLQGRRVMQPTKGLFITSDGRKVVR